MMVRILPQKSAVYVGSRQQDSSLGFGTELMCMPSVTSVCAYTVTVAYVLVIYTVYIRAWTA